MQGKVIPLFYFASFSKSSVGKIKATFRFKKKMYFIKTANRDAVCNYTYCVVSQLGNKGNF